MHHHPSEFPVPCGRCNAFAPITLLSISLTQLCWSISFAINHASKYTREEQLKDCLVAFGHDDVIKWKLCPRYWPFVRGIHRSPVNSPHKGQWRGALMFSLICVWINGWVNNRESGDLRRYPAHYDVTVMTTEYSIKYARCVVVVWLWYYVLLDPCEPHVLIHTRIAWTIKVHSQFMRFRTKAHIRKTPHLEASGVSEIWRRDVLPLSELRPCYLYLSGPIYGQGNLLLREDSKIQLLCCPSCNAVVKPYIYSNNHLICCMTRYM